MKASLKSRDVNPVFSHHYIPIILDILYSLASFAQSFSYMRPIKEMARDIFHESANLILANLSVQDYRNSMNLPVKESKNFNVSVKHRTATGGGLMAALAIITLLSTTYLIYKNLAARINPFRHYPVKVIVILIACAAMLSFAIYRIAIGQVANPSDLYLNAIHKCEDLYEY